MRNVEIPHDFDYLHNMAETGAMIRASRRQLYYMMRDGLLANVIVGKRRFVRRSEIDRYLKQNAA